MEQLSYCRHRFPPAVIQHAIWLYLRFTLSYGDVEDLLAERGLDMSLRLSFILGRRHLLLPERSAGIADDEREGGTLWVRNSDSEIAAAEADPACRARGSGSRRRRQHSGHEAQPGAGA